MALETEQNSGLDATLENAAKDHNSTHRHGIMNRHLLLPQLPTFDGEGLLDLGKLCRQGYDYWTLQGKARLRAS